ncbi:glucans biosynthesis glucosyltransferase MdoH [Amylibacter sp. IMCC11727]|uniref:glucans biosynthesis glucosyltransferase MdoH n=1 Tax=Amylibacter sp. IMCC11727 TaxID=3039851 RepID=UPI00244E166C|nr:glucans biosynthesis glucosyltransferase MdoH [Amylibacter sp. IMCC11727]WGI23248.1 glucans biosynthesis glucosyltransferase MdoH [Amylibacter sp. IMCC11727]
MNSFSPIIQSIASQRIGDETLGITGHMWMPDTAPLHMPTQNFAQPFAGPRVTPPRTPKSVWVRRAATLIPAVAATFAVTGYLASVLSVGGLSVLEIIWLALIFSTFIWIAFTFVSALAGMAVALKKPQAHDQSSDIGSALRVAVLSPIYNESPSHVFGNVAAMMAQLRNTASRHSYAFFLLSDTTDPDIAALEEEAMLHLRAQMSFDVPIYYRRRTENLDRKTGNLAQWITHWGGAYDAMLVLDADSVMDASAVVSLSDDLAADPTLGLVQTCPRLFGSHTVFGCMQQFSSAAFGLFPALGEAFWSHREANYHGHNAIVRTRAFAQCAGLPYLKDRKGKTTLIFSHDFVEAALLRRAGWGVKMRPTLDPTYEETPTTLIDYILRDRRWCQGNMQHLRIMWAKGLHPVSRFHLGINALTYLMSPLWFGLITIGALLGTSAGGGVLAFVTGRSADSYINFALFNGSGLWVLGLVYFMLIAPKLAGAAAVLCDTAKADVFQGRVTFSKGALMELLGSMAVAPVLMVQQTKAIVGILTGRHENWGPQKRYGARYDLRTILRFHVVETVLGAVLMVGILGGAVSLWLLPIAISLVGAPVLSAVSGMNLRGTKTKLFFTPFEAQVPPIISAASHHQKQIANNPYQLVVQKVAAE